MRSVTVHIAKDGTTTTDFAGFQGASCLEAAEQLRQRLSALGIQSEITHLQAKPELGVSQAQAEPQRGSVGQQQEGIK